ncbi:hypothetical protein [Caldithrix abyssi]
MKYILGFRQYLHSPKSYEDLKQIIHGQKKYFSPDEGFLTIVAVCGDNPRDFLEDEGLRSSVAFYDYAPWEESAKRVAGVFARSIHKPQRVQIIHYNERPLGLTYPLELLVQIANALNAEHLAVSDSDFQLSYSEIRRVYDHHIANADPDEIVITYPRRQPRSLDTEKYPINRWAMEDLENMYIYFLSDLKVLNSKPDFQSGLSITTRAANKILNFDNVGSWIGNLHMAIQVIRNKGRLDKDFVVKTNVQHESTINFDVQCAKIDQLYRYYMIPLSNIVELALEHPDKYLMEDWTAGMSKEEIAETIKKIEALNRRYLEEKIKKHLQKK